MLASAAIVVICMLAGWILFRQRSILRHSIFQLEKERKKADFLSSIINNSRDGIVIQDMNGLLLWANPSWCEMFGYEVDEVLGKNPLSFVIPAQKRLSDEEISEFRYDLSSGFLDQTELIENETKNGKKIWVALSFSYNISENGEDRVVVICRDVTHHIEREEQLKKKNEVIAFRADHDALTAVANREKLFRFYEEVRLEAKQRGTNFGLLHIDLDHFKSINDTFGHSAGDAVIMKTADRMRAAIGPNDLLARIGGDEFVIVCPNASEFTALQDVAENIIKTVSKPITWEDRILRVGASVGAGLSSKTVSDYTALMQNADVALYEAKKKGRGQVACYDREMDRTYFDKMRLAAELVEALEKGEIDVYLQPQFSLIAKAVTGFEALIRWHHPTRGTLLPSDFLEIATDIGVIQDIDRLAATKAFAALRMLDDAGFNGLQMAVNVSPLSMSHNDYVDFMKWEADKYGLDNDRVAIEILETTFFSETESKTSNAIRTLSKAGFRVELDDFGTGYAGLSHLGRLKVDGVKIDKTMVEGISKNVTNQIIVQAMVGLCSDLGLHVIAEGVTSQVDAQILRQFGCINVQGCGISDPLPLHEVENWLNDTDMRAILINQPFSNSNYQTVAS